MSKERNDEKKCILEISENYKRQYSDNSYLRIIICTHLNHYKISNCVQNGSGAHPASYPMSTGSSFPGGKAAGA
jgi:hypothetical protein